MLKKSLKFLAAPACALTAFSGILAILPGLTQAPPPPPTTTCSFDPNSGKQNPLGMRASVTIREVKNDPSADQRDTTFIYEQFPSTAPGGNRAAVTIAQRRELTFYNTPVADARRLLLNTPGYYSTLLGTNTPEDFAPVNAVLTCQVGANPSPSPTTSPTTSPTSSPTAQTSKLPDGNYRYWTGRPRGPIVSDEELLQNGGILFLFNKKGNQIVGTYGQIDNIGICLSGQINENTFTGVAIEQGDASVISDGDRFVAWDAAGLLRVRRGSKTGERIQYNSAIADLRSFTRINAGNREPITRCP
jgi:hypothetical protein